MITVQRGSGQGSRWVDVRDFGAVGDGVTDNTVALQAALNSGKYLIYAPVGTYNHTGLTLPNRVSIQGDASSGGTTLNYTPSTGNGITMVSDTEFNQLRNLKLYSEGHSTGWAIYHSGTRCTDFYFESVSLESFYKGFHTDAGLNGRISSMRISGRGKATAGGMGIQMAAGSGLCTFDSVYISTVLTGMDVSGPNHLILRPIVENATTGIIVRHITTIVGPYFNEVDTILETDSTSCVFTEPVVYHTSDGGFLGDAFSRITLDASGEKSEFLTNKSFVRAKRSGTNQTIPSGVDTVVIFNSADTDITSDYAAGTGIFTAKKPGRYMVQAKLQWSGAVSDTTMQVIKNSTAMSNVNFAGSNYSMAITDAVWLSRGDTLKITARQDSGVDKDIYSVGVYTNLSISEM